MNDQVTLKVNSHKETEFEFDVQIQGLSEETTNASDVRFVVVGINGQYDVSVKCAPTPANQWHVRLPCLSLTSVDQPFKIEVIVDGYYFVPVQGTLLVMSEPKVDMGTAVTNKPVVSATFVQTEVDFVESKQPVKTRRLLETADMNKKLRTDIASKVLVASRIMSKASAMLEESADVENLNSKVIAGTLNTVKQAIELVEIKVYVNE
jgi:hypothetical protein